MLVSAVLQAPRLWGAEVSGVVVDAKTGQTLAARVYLQSRAGEWFFPESAAPDGSAVRYAKTNWVNQRAMEVHTTLSAHPFRVQLPPGSYSLTV